MIITGPLLVFLCVVLGAKSLRHVQHFVNLWTIAGLYTPLSMDFSRQEY